MIHGDIGEVTVGSIRRKGRPDMGLMHKDECSGYWKQRWCTYPSLIFLIPTLRDHDPSDHVMHNYPRISNTTPYECLAKLGPK